MRHAAPVILLAFASVLFSCGGAGKEDGGCHGSETPSDVLRVMSFNILYSHRQTEEAYTDGDGRKWAERLPNVVSGLKSRGFDVMASQENTLRQIDDVLDALGDYSAVGKSFGGKAVGAVASDPDAVEVEAVYYRKGSVKLLESGTFWYSETPDTPATARFVEGLELPNNRNSNWAKMEWMGKPFFVFTTHLQVGLDDACVRQRLYQAEILVRKIGEIAGDAPVILAGDFNCILRRDSVSDVRDAIDYILENSSLRDARVLCANPSGPYGTVWYYKTGTPATRRIDFVLVNEGFLVHSYRVDDIQQKTGKWESDHHPVIVDVSFL